VVADRISPMRLLSINGLNASRREAAFRGSSGD
jgi:hypothetical protein